MRYSVTSTFAELRIELSAISGRTSAMLALKYFVAQGAVLGHRMTLAYFRTTIRPHSTAFLSRFEVFPSRQSWATWSFAGQLDWSVMGAPTTW
jgi:hypothetical protein